MIEAPVKELVVLDTSGHRPLFEQPDAFVDYMVRTVLADTHGRRRRAPDDSNRWSVFGSSRESAA